MKALSMKIVIILCGVLLLCGCFGEDKTRTQYIDYTDGNSVIDDNFIIGDASCINSIEFISATPNTIALKGTGGPSRSEISRLVFKVVDDYGHPVPDEVVEFTLSTRIGGLSLANYSDRSNEEGLVQTTVNAGNMSTHVRVHATLRNSSDGVTIVSDALTVSTGLPDQDSISFSPPVYNPEAWNYDNEEVELVFIAADHFNNFVPDGTVVYFSAEGGSIDDSCMLTDGVCSVTWRSGNPRPDNGRVTILAFCIGEESFKNDDNNGLFDDPNDLFDPDTDDRAEPYLDENENNQRDIGEQYWDYNQNGEFDEANGMYNGSLCSGDQKAQGDCTTDLVYVQAEIKPLIMSGSWANVVFDKVNGDGTITPNIDRVDLSDEGIARVRISIADVNNNSMPYGTKIELSTTNGELVSETSYDVPNAIGPFTITALVESGEDEKTIGVLQVKVTTPKGNKTSASIIVTDDLVSDDSVPDDDPIIGNASSIEFISATPHTIALKGTGGPSRSEISHLLFKVVDEDGHSVPNEVVEFTLSTEIGGLFLSDCSDDSNNEGLVYTAVNAGNMSTHVRVHARLRDSSNEVKIVSDELLVSTGLPDKDSISFSPPMHNPEAWNYDNEEVEILFMAADHFNNFVPDGTVVYFSTEGGSIDDSCTLIDGVCTVTWRSGNPRPDDGRVTILAFCIGEESFKNNDNNGLFDDPDDLFDPNTDDMAEPYLDENENNQRDVGEQYWDYNQNGTFDEANGIYNGSLCSGDKKANGDCTTDLVYVQAELKPLVMSGSWADISFMPNNVDLAGKDIEWVEIYINDVNNNPMPCGTKIDLETTNGILVSEASYTVPSTISPSPPIIAAITPDDPNNNIIKIGYLTVTVTTPNGNVTSASILVADDTVPSDIVPVDPVSDDDPITGEASSIEFVAATPNIIALKGTGGPSRSEISHLVFKVVDEYGYPVPHEVVEFTLSTTIGGLSLSDSTDDSNVEGFVNTTVNAGNMSTHVRVNATLCNSDHLVTIVSDELLVSTGLPDQDSIDLVPTIRNPEAWDYNDEVTIVFTAADHFNNFVPDGTVVYFSTEGGSIEDSCSLYNGACDVIWRGGNPRPSDGRVTILAHCIGEESFENYDNNGLFDDPNDKIITTTDMAEPYLDVDQDGERDPWEQYWDYNQNGVFDESNGIYNGSLCSGDKKASGDCTTDLVYVQAEIKPLVMSGSWATIIFDPNKLDLAGKEYGYVSIYIHDENNNPMPYGTTIELKTSNGTLETEASHIVPSTIIPYPYPIPAVITPDDPNNNKNPYGILEVKVTTPHEVQSVGFIPVWD